MNKKGFALTETLVVTVFLVTIFTFIYVSIFPLLGKYESIIQNEEDIDIVYKLYHIRKMIINDSERSNITKNSATNNEVSKITCNLFNKKMLCEKLMEQLNLAGNYTIIFAKHINNTNIGYIINISPEIGEYVTKHQNKIQDRTIFLLDTKTHAIGYLHYDDLTTN